MSIGTYNRTTISCIIELNDDIGKAPIALIIGSWLAALPYEERNKELVRWKWLVEVVG
jgi:hypothetical protein